jgi:hypothetical protein
MPEEVQGIPRGKDQEPTATAIGVPVEQPKSRQAFSRAKRELSEDEMTSPGVPKMLLDEVDRLDRENFALVDFRRRFHEADKECVLLRAKENKSIASDIIFGGCMALGGIVLGNLSNLPKDRPDLTDWAFAVGIILFVIAIGARVFQRR